MKYCGGRVVSVALLDTTSYLKLGRSLHPILGRTIGQPPRICRTISEVDREFEGKESLAATFHWVPDSPYAENRKQNLLSAMQIGLKEVSTWRTQIQAQTRMDAGEYRKRNLTPPSPADALLIAYAVAISDVYGQRAAVVSDDAGVRFAAEQLDLCDAMSGYQLVKIFLEHQYVDLNQVKALYAELDYFSELPGDWRANCEETFGFRYSR